MNDFDKLALNQTDEDNDNILSSSRRAFIADLSKEVSHARATQELKPFILTFKLWCQVADVTRYDYKSLLKIFKLLNNL